MREILTFFLKYSTIFAFVGYQSLCFYCLSLDNSYQRVKILNFTNNITGSVLNAKNSIVNIFDIEKENELLKIENEQLLEYKFDGKTIIADNLFENVLKSISGNKIVTTDTVSTSKYNFLSANVINNSFIKTNNFITLNKGYAQGVKKDQGIIGKDGIVGIVTNVSKNYCTIMSVLNSKFFISSKLKKDNTVGTVNWNGENADYANLVNIPTHVKLQKGDTIVTTGYSTFFPENVNIGFIESFKPISGKDVYEIKIKLSTNFRNISYVYAVENSEKQEQLQLEKANF